MKKSLLFIIIFSFILNFIFSNESVIKKSDSPPDYKIDVGEWDFIAWNDKNFNPEKSYNIKGAAKCVVPGLWNEASKLPLNFKNSLGERWYDKIDYAWYIKEFSIPAEYKEYNSVIQFGSVKWSAEVWLNGIKLGKSDIPFAPFELQAGDVLKYGEKNTLMLKVGGWNSIPRDSSQLPECAIGYAFNNENLSGGILENVNLHFYKKARIKRLQIVPNLKEKSIRVSFSVNLPQDFNKLLNVGFTIQEAETGKTVRKYNLPPISYERKRKTDLLFLLKMSDFKEWNLENPFLYNLITNIHNDDGDIKL